MKTFELRTNLSDIIISLHLAKGKVDSHFEISHDLIGVGMRGVRSLKKHQRNVISRAHRYLVDRNLLKDFIQRCQSTWINDSCSRSPLPIMDITVSNAFLFFCDTLDSRSYFYNSNSFIA